MLFGKLTDRDTKDMTRIISNIMEESFLSMRDGGFTYKSLDEFADGVELNMRDAFEGWLEDETYGYEVSDCDEFMDRNTRWCLELASMVKENEILRAEYDMNALDPHVFVHEVYAFLTHRLVEYLAKASEPVAKICEAEIIKVGFLEEYILSAEARKYITAEAIEKVMENLEKETEELRSER